MKKVLLVLLTNLLFACTAIKSSSSCSDCHVLYIDDSATSSVDFVGVLFTQFYEDTVEVYVNDDLVKKKYVKTDESLGFAEFVELDIQKRSDLVKIMYQGNELSFYPNRYFRSCRVEYDYGEWYIMYENSTTVEWE